MVLKEMGKREDVLGNLHQISTCIYIFFEITNKNLFGSGSGSAKYADSGSGFRVSKTCGSMRIRIHITDENMETNIISIYLNKSCC